MDAEILVKISRDNIPVGRSPGGPKRRWSDLIIDWSRRNRLQKRRQTVRLQKAIISRAELPPMSGNKNLCADRMVSVWKGSIFQGFIVVLPFGEFHSTIINSSPNPSFPFMSFHFLFSYFIFRSLMVSKNNRLAGYYRWLNHVIDREASRRVWCIVSSTDALHPLTSIIKYLFDNNIQKNLFFLLFFILFVLISK